MGRNLTPYQIPDGMTPLALFTRAFFMREVFMKSLIETMQYIFAAVVLFMLVYILYMLVVSVSIFMLPIAFVVAAGIVWFAAYDKEKE